MLSLIPLLAWSLGAGAAPKKMSKADWKPSVPAPAWKTVHALAQTAALPRVQSYSKLHALGGSRFAAVLGLRKGGREGPQLTLVLLDKTGGTWRLARLLLADYAGAAASAAQRRIVKQCKEAEAATGDPGRVRVSLYPGDYDSDGQAELKVRHRFAGCAGEALPELATPPTRLQIVKTTPLGLALDTTIQVGEGPEEHDRFTTRLDHRKDLNHDGYTDLLIHTRAEDFACQLGQLTITTELRSYHYQPQSGRFKLVATQRDRKTKKQESW